MTDTAKDPPRTSYPIVEGGTSIDGKIVEQTDQPSSPPALHEDAAAAKESAGAPLESSQE